MGDWILVGGFLLIVAVLWLLDPNGRDVLRALRDSRRHRRPADMETPLGKKRLP